MMTEMDSMSENGPEAIRLKLAALYKRRGPITAALLKLTETADREAWSLARFRTSADANLQLREQIDSEIKRLTERLLAFND